MKNLNVWDICWHTSSTDLSNMYSSASNISFEIEYDYEQLMSYLIKHPDVFNKLIADIRVKKIKKIKNE